jgi:hypothetical protein
MTNIAVSCRPERQSVDREPPEWAKRNIAFFQRLQASRDRQEARHPMYRRYVEFVLVFFLVGSIISAVAARTLLGHVWGTLIAAFYVVATIYVWKKRHPRT